jgi:hypothetical protein
LHGRMVKNVPNQAIDSVGEPVWFPH